MRILGYDYELALTKSIEDGGMTEAGKTYVAAHKIYIANDLCRQEKASTVLHEVIETINYCLGLDLPHNSILALEVSLFQVLRDLGMDIYLFVSELDDMEEKA
jgi:hypothetical protein